MTTIYKKITIILFVILVVGCQNRETNDDLFSVIKIDIDNISKESINDWFDSIELIPLTSTSNSFIKEVCKILKFENNYYILDNWQHTVFVFDSIGNYINSTQHLKGAGPNEYISLIDFDIDKVNGNLHLLDPVSSKIRIYDRNLSHITNCNINNQVLPLQFFKVHPKNAYLPFQIYMDLYIYDKRILFIFNKNTTDPCMIKYKQNRMPQIRTFSFQKMAYSLTSQHIDFYQQDNRFFNLLIFSPILQVRILRMNLL